MAKMSENLNRRDFVILMTKGILTVSGLLGLGGIIRFFSYYKKEYPTNEINLGPADQYPVGSKTILNQVPAILYHTEGSFKALSLTCTHLGCTVEESEEAFHCPCHGSGFNADGNVLNGPANQPLRTLKVELISDGTLVLFKK